MFKKPDMKFGWMACLLLLGAQAPKPQVLESSNSLPEFSELLQLNLTSGLVLMEQQAQANELEQAKGTGVALLALRNFDGWRSTLDLETDSWWNPLLNQAERVAEVLKLSFTPTEEAHVRFALGVVALQAGEGPEALRGFQKATALAGAGGLREDATYNTGTLALLSGENWRSQLPELGGTPPAPPAAAPVAPGAPPAPEQEAPDPLEEARKAYLVARGHFILRLRLDWRDADTRANMELVMRRLRELDEIEKQREEEEQEQEENEDEQSEDSEDEQSEEDKEKEKSEDESDQDSESEKNEEQEPEDPGEEESEEPEEEPEPEPSEEEPQQDQEEEQSSEPEESPEEPKQEVYLTKEEVQRLLDRLKEHEEQGQELRDRRRQQRRPTARDW